MSSPSTIILITGAKSGVGYSTAQVLGSQVNYHIILATCNPKSGSTALAEVQSSSGVKGSFSTVTLDVDDAESVRLAVKEVEQESGRVNVLVNDAGVGESCHVMSHHLTFTRGTPYTATVEDFEKTFRTNVVGPFLVTDTFKHLMLKSTNPYSIYVSTSLASFDRALDASLPSYKMGWVVYRASKAALNMLVVEETKVLGEQGARTFAVCPGYVVSNLRGTSEEQRPGWGGAGDSMVSGETLLRIVKGERDGDVGKFVHKDGVYSW